MKTIKNDLKLTLCYTPIYQLPPQILNIEMHALKIHNHYCDLQKDPNYGSASIIAIAESRLTNEDSDSDYAMQGFTLFRNDQHSHNQHRPSHGLAVYVKEEIDVQIVDLYSSKHIEWMFLKPNINDSDIQIICIYNSNDTSHQTLTSTFLQYLYPLIDHCKPLVIIGDFNINCNINTIPVTIREILETLKCQQKVTQLTTDSSIIDLIITNIDNIQTGIINTAWSDHKLIWARI